MNDPANTALKASDLTAPLFGDDSEIANNVALYEISVVAADNYRFLSTGFAAGGIDPYFTLFQSTGNGATVLGSNYDQAFSTGGDFNLTFALAAGDYTVGIGAFANMSFAENFGAGTLGDGFIGLGVPSLGTTYYNLEITPGAAAPEPRPLWLAALGLGLGLLWRRLRNTAACALLAAAIPAQASSIYTVQKVAGNSEGYFTISGTMGINNFDAIVFDARVGSNVNQNGVFVGNGGAIGTIAKTTQAGGDYAGVTPTSLINNSGFVPFRAILPDGSTAILAGDGGTPATIATAGCGTCDFTQITRAPAINDAGDVAFQ
ncbi:MAG TPA: DVUA0089 family protein, partial [Bryobacteraceae bacterium]